MARHIRGEMARERVEECPSAKQCSGLCCNVVSNVSMSGTDFSDKFRTTIDDRAVAPQGHRLTPDYFSAVQASCPALWLVVAPL